MRIKIPLAKGVCAVISLLTIGIVRAEPVAYSEFAEFHAALPTEPTVLDFDQLPAGMTIEASTTAGGITFEYDFDGLPMKVTRMYATTSAPNFLGTSDGGMFHDGDNFTLTFTPGNAVGLFFISADPLLDGDISVTVGTVTARLMADQVYTTLNDGSRVYFIGIIDIQRAFTTARIEALAGGFFLYNVDDIITAPVQKTVASATSSDLSVRIAVDQ